MSVTGDGSSSRLVDLLIGVTKNRPLLHSWAACLNTLTKCGVEWHSPSHFVPHLRR